MSSVVSKTLAAYLAGRVRADHLVAVVTAAYYGNGKGRGRKRDALRPLIDVIERASPGVVQLAGTPEGAGFDVRPAERPFPEQWEPELRRAVETYLGRQESTARADVGAQHAAPLPVASVTSLSLVARVFQAIQRLLRASA
jgi:hypothetical protein